MSEERLAELGYDLYHKRIDLKKRLKGKKDFEKDLSHQEPLPYEKTQDIENQKRQYSDSIERTRNEVGSIEEEMKKLIKTKNTSFEVYKGRTLKVTISYLEDKDRIDVDLITIVGNR